MRPRTLLLVLAGGAGGRLELLTEQRAKPAVPVTLIGAGERVTGQVPAGARVPETD